MDKPKYDVTSVFLRLVHFVENDNVYTLTKTYKNKKKGLLVRNTWSFTVLFTLHIALIQQITHVCLKGKCITSL